MMKFIRNIRNIIKIYNRLDSLKDELYAVEEHLVRRGIEFEKKLQDMSFAYTKNLDDAKSDYLKRYLEQRLDGMKYDIDHKWSDFNRSIDILSHRIEDSLKYK